MDRTLSPGLITSHLNPRHPFPDSTKVVHNAFTGSRNKGGCDAPSRWFFPTELANTIEFKESSPRPRLARIVVLLCIRNQIREHQTHRYVI